MSKVYLVTGATGFVGKYLVEYLSKKPDIQIVGTYRSRRKNLGTKYSNVIFEQVVLNDLSKVFEIIIKYKPDYIIHLAAESSVGYSWSHPVISFNNNVNIFLNLLEAVRVINLPTRILSVGSSEGYGIVNNDKIPLKEDAQLNPISPYAVARVSQELISKVYVDGYGLDIVLTRSFNHFGPGQDERFVIPSFIKRVIKRRESKSKQPVETGNLSIIRDFLDVRDVVKAYIELLEYGVKGEIYNVCSSQGVSLKEVLDSICKIARYEVKAKPNRKYIRLNDNPVIVGDYSKIKIQTGWQPTYSLKQTLVDTINYVECCNLNENYSTIANM